jgi:hypothetical protein
VQRISGGALQPNSFHRCSPFLLETFMSGINYSEKIPNNVNLSEDRTLQRALEQWQPNFINWWDDVGPVGTTDAEVYLRTAVSVDPQGWAQFGHVKMRDYRWGIFLNPGGKTCPANTVLICAVSSSRKVTLSPHRSSSNATWA